jgi:hypothetical protein
VANRLETILVRDYGGQPPPIGVSLKHRCISTAGPAFESPRQT